MQNPIFCLSRIIRFYCSCSAVHAFWQVFLGAQQILTGMESGRYYDGMYGNRQHYRNSAFGQHCSEVLKDYETQKKAGKNPVFKAENVGIKNTDCWK